MVEQQAEVIRKTRELAESLLAKGVDVRRVYLFGSRAQGETSDTADIDVAVISPDFGHDYLHEATELLKAAEEIDLSFDPKPYSLKEFELSGQDSFIRQEVVAKGILVFRRDP